MSLSSPDSSAASATPADFVSAEARRPWWRLTLTQQIFLGLVLGCLLGWAKPAWAVDTALIRDIFRWLRYRRAVADLRART